MNKLNRRKFLTLAGVGSAAAASAVLPGADLLTGTGAGKNGVYTFRAVVGLPKKPLPAYASYVIEGHVDLATRSGVLTKAIFAGTPQAMSTVALPGLSRIVRITDVQELGGTLRITGVVDDRSQLQRGESPTTQILVDRSRGVVQAGFFGNQVLLNLEK
jgi:hypothetical protein